MITFPLQNSLVCGLSPNYGDYIKQLLLRYCSITSCKIADDADVFYSHSRWIPYFKS